MAPRRAHPGCDDPSLPIAPEYVPCDLHHRDLRQSDLARVSLGALLAGFVELIDPALDVLLGGPSGPRDRQLRVGASPGAWGTRYVARRIVLGFGTSCHRAGAFHSSAPSSAGAGVIHGLDRTGLLHRRVVDRRVSRRQLTPAPARPAARVRLRSGSRSSAAARPWGPRGRPRRLPPPTTARRRTRLGMLTRISFIDAC